MRTSEAWYSIVKSIKADGDVFNVTEANTMESLVLCRACFGTEQARFRRVCRCPQGVACMKRSTQELGRPCQFLIVRVGMKYPFLLERKNGTQDIQQYSKIPALMRKVPPFNEPEMEHKH